MTDDQMEQIKGGIRTGVFGLREETRTAVADLREEVHRLGVTLKGLRGEIRQVADGHDVLRQEIHTLREANDAAHQEIVSLVRASSADLDARHTRIWRDGSSGEPSGDVRPQGAYTPGFSRAVSRQPYKYKLGSGLRGHSALAATVASALKIKDLTPEPGGDSAGFKTSCLVAQPNLPIVREGAAEREKVACLLIPCEPAVYPSMRSTAGKTSGPTPCP